MQDNARQKMLRLRAENHIKNHRDSIARSDIGKIYQNLKDKGCDCEIIYLEASDFEEQIEGTSKNRSIKDLLAQSYDLSSLSTLASDYLIDVSQGGWNPSTCSNIFLEVLSKQDLEGKVYVIGETLEVILAATAKDLVPHLEDLCKSIGITDLYIMEKNARWLLQFSRHSKFLFGRKSA